MAGFKLNIADTKAGRCYKSELKEDQSSILMGLNIGEKVDGNKIGFDGYEFQVTGGTDHCGFPMRRGILGVRKKLVIYPGLGFRRGLKGMKKRKTVCGHKINDKISAVNLKVVKEGPKKMSELFGKPDDKKDETAKNSQDKKPEVKVEKTEVKKETKEITESAAKDTPAVKKEENESPKAEGQKPAAAPVADKKDTKNVTEEKK
jgi:small subunit ribosomal protein S6e